MRVISFNIRFDNPEDGQNCWDGRREMAVALLQKYEPDVVGLQEALLHQIGDLEDGLPGYRWFGVARDDGQSEGEFNPIFYRSDRLELVRQSTFWLSETPEQPGGHDWGADCRRIVTWGEFREKDSNTSFLLFNTHFDHRSQEARTKSAWLLLEKVEEIAGDRHHDEPVIVTGDFNCTPDSQPYRILTQGGRAGSRPDAFFLEDAQVLSQNGHRGPGGTLNLGFASVIGAKIDHIFVKSGVDVVEHAVLDDSWNGRFPSDHFAVLIDFELV